MTGRVLVVAGSDSGAGAGIQADIKTVGALGGYATTAITALTAQNTRGVQAVMAVPPDFVRRQIESVFDDIGADCIKTGMLHSAAVLDMLCDFIAARAAISRSSSIPCWRRPTARASSTRRRSICSSAASSRSPPC